MPAHSAYYGLVTDFHDISSRMPGVFLYMPLSAPVSADSNTHL